MADVSLAALIATVAIFILINGVFVAAEFAVIGAPKAAIEHRASQGDRLAGRLHALLSSAPRQDRYIATSQLGVTIASLGLGMFGEHELAAWLSPHLAFIGGWHVVTVHAAALVSAVALLTFVHLVIGEMLPKSIAFQWTERLARLLYWPMRVAYVASYPFVTLLHGLGKACLALVGIRRQPEAADESYTPEELELIVEESERGGQLRADEGRLLRELFDFGDLTAEQAMVPRVRTTGVPLGAGAEEIRQVLRAHRHTRYPVYDGDLDHIVGMLHVKDLLRKLVSGEAIARADLRPMPVVPVTAPLDDVLAEMERAHAHMVLVIDEHGGTAGVLSFEDLSEEVVGDIQEGAADVRSIVRDAPGVVRAAGTARLDELGEQLGVELVHDEVDSVSGLVLAQLGRPPVVGDVVQYGGVRLEVTALAGRGVGEVRAATSER